MAVAGQMMMRTPTTRRARVEMSPRLHQFSQSARLRQELLPAAQMAPEPEPEPETDPVSTKPWSLAEARANVKRNPPMKAQTPRLRAKAVAKAAKDSPWPSKNVSAPPQPSTSRLAERGAETEDEPRSLTGRPAAGRPDELAQRLAPAKIAEILAGLQELSDNPAVQRLLENSIAGHSGLYIPTRERMVSRRWTNAKHVVRARQAVGGADTSARHTALLSDDTGLVRAIPGHRMLEARPFGYVSADEDAQKWTEHAVTVKNEQNSMFERISVVDKADGVSMPRTAGFTLGIPNDQSTGSSGSGRRTTAVPALPALAPAPDKPGYISTVPAAVRRLRGVLQVHPATAHKHFTAEHLTAINRLVVDGLPIKPNAEDPVLSAPACSVFLTSSVPGEFETIHAGDIITIVVDGQPVRRRVLAEEQPVKTPITEVAQLPPDAIDKPRMSRALLRAIFEQLDQKGDGVVDEQELLHSVATDETLAQLLQLPPESPQVSPAENQRALQDDVATVQAVMTSIVKKNKQNYDAEVKTAMIDLVSPRGGQRSPRGTRRSLPAADQLTPSSITDSSLEVSTAAMAIPDRAVLEAMAPDAVRQLALDLGIPPEQVGAAAPPRQVGFEEFAQFLESLVASTEASPRARGARSSPRGRPDTPDTLQVDAPFCDKNLDGVAYSVSRHLRPVAEWGLAVDLPGVERPDGITWEAAGVLAPQIRADVAVEDLATAMMLARLTPRMETVNRNKSGRATAAGVALQRPVAKPPKDQRVYRGPASLRGRRMRAVGMSARTGSAYA